MELLPNNYQQIVLSKYEKIFIDAGLDDVLRRELINNFDGVFSKFGNLLAMGTKKVIQSIDK